jgi:hypothetical protein
VSQFSYIDYPEKTGLLCEPKAIERGPHCIVRCKKVSKIIFRVEQIMKIGASLAVASVFLLVAACGGGGGAPPTESEIPIQPATGIVNIAITDAPVDEVSVVNVQFTAVVLKPSSGDEIEIVFESPKDFDLLKSKSFSNRPRTSIC